MPSAATEASLVLPGETPELQDAPTVRQSEKDPGGHHRPALCQHFFREVWPLEAWQAPSRAHLTLLGTKTAPKPSAT